jgi:uncharacterized protein
MKTPRPPMKIIVSGPVGAGKTTFIQNLSDIPVVNTDEAATENIGKSTTTVALDYGVLHLADEVIHIYGTPGQERFEFMWEILCDGALGLLLLVSGRRPGDFRKARVILEYITSRIPAPFIIGVTHQDCSDAWDPGEVADYFQLPPEQCVGVVTVERTSAAAALATLIEFIRTSS